MKYFAALLIIFAGSSSHAFRSGTLTCFFEIRATDKPNTTRTSESFTFDITQFYGNAFSFPFLSNRILLAYYPGFEKPGDVTFFSFILKYDGANAGSDVPAVNGATYYTNISKDGTDLIGAFMKCQAANLK